MGVLFGSFDGKSTERRGPVVRLQAAEANFAKMHALENRARLLSLSGEHERSLTLRSQAFSLYLRGMQDLRFARFQIVTEKKGAAPTLEPRP